MAFATVVACVGMALVATGFALFWVPGAFIVPGLGLMALGLFGIDVERQKDQDEPRNNRPQ